MTFPKALTLGAAALFLAFQGTAYSGGPEFDPAPLAKAAKAIESRLNTRIGVAVFDPASRLNWNYNGDERFPMNSTMKAFACAALLDRVDKKQSTLDQRTIITSDMIVSYSPVTEKHINTADLTLADHCEATITISDNTSANIILEELGGPIGVTTYMRSIGDDVTRLDRYEPSLNEGTPGDPRDTTTPVAAAQSLYKVLFSDELSVSSRKQLMQWLEANKVGDATLRAGLPHDWRIGDKTGAGAYGSRGNIAIIWPPNHTPVALAVYVTENEAEFQARNKAIAEIGAAFKASFKQ